MTAKNLPKIVVVLATAKTDNPTLCNICKGVKTMGDPVVISPPVTDSDLSLKADAIILVRAQRQTDKSPSLTLQETELAGILRRMYNKDARYVQDMANDWAVTKGDVAAGEEVVVRCGFKMKNKLSVHPREFEIVQSGVGWFHLRVKAIAKRAGYAWRYGITTAKDTPPALLSPVIFTLECEVVINNMKSGSIYGFQEASILPVARTSKTSPAIKAKATPSAATKAHKPSFSDGQPPQQFGNFIYEGCK